MHKGTDIVVNSGHFQPGNTLTAKRVHNNGGRPPGPITSIRQEIEEHPGRTRELLDHLYELALHSESDKVQLAASVDYLDRIGLRAPKQTDISIHGQVVLGTPEDYRRTMVLLAADRAREQALLLGETVIDAVVVEAVNEDVSPLDSCADIEPTV